MKIATIIVRVLLGLVFLVFGIIDLFHLVDMTMPPSDATTLMLQMMHHGWFVLIGVLYVIAGLLLVMGRYVPVGLVIVGRSWW